MSSVRPRFTQDSEAMKLLRQKFEKGDIDGSENPKAVWESDRLFKEHKLATFRAHYNIVRKEYERLSDDDVPLVRRLRSTGAAPTKRMKLSSEASQDDEVGPNEAAITEGFEGDSASFTPLYTMSTWKEAETLTERVTVAIVLPSGVSSGNFSLQVVDSGNSLELTIRWPAPLVDLQMLHKKWLETRQEKYESYHPEYNGFNENLRKRRSHSSNWVTSSAKIPLPIQVQSNIFEKHNLSWRNDSTKLLYVRLKATVDDYAIQNDDK